jgi:integrase
VDLDASTIALAPEDTKTDEPRLIVLTSRAKEALRTLPSRFKRKGHVFVNPKKKTRWADIKKRFRRAVDAAELPGLWFHDLRRSFITRARSGVSRHADERAPHARGVRAVQRRRHPGLASGSART